MTINGPKSGILGRLGISIVLSLVFASLPQGSWADEAIKIPLKTSAELEKAESDPAFVAEVQKAKALIRQHPTEEVNYAHLGNLYYDLGDYKQAIPAFREELKVNAKDTETYRVIASSYHLLGDAGKAVSTMTQGLKAVPGNAELYFYRGILREGLKDYDGMHSDLNDAIKINPSDGKFFSYRAAYFDMVADWKSAIVDATEAIRLSPQRRDSYRIRAKAYEALGQTELRDKDLARFASLAK